MARVLQARASKGPLCEAGCGRGRERWQRLCPHCWRLLPPHRRAGIEAARRERAAHIVSLRVREAAAWLRDFRSGPAARRIGERD